MVENGQPQIQPVDFDSRLHAALPVEVIDRMQLIRRVGRQALLTPQRPSFTSFILMRSGHGGHTVDFERIAAKQNRLVQIRPGQVQVWDTAVDSEATLVVSQPGVAASRSWFPGHRPYCDLDEDAAATAEAIVASLRRQQTKFDGHPAARRLMVALFEALSAVFDLAAAAGDEDRLPAVYVAFRNAVETDFGNRHDVVDYAQHLGYSARTITRACLEVTGLTAKKVISERLVLEAKRLLVHTDRTAAQIGSELGFSEPTNFAKFFFRNTGNSPGRFRLAHRPSA